MEEALQLPVKQSVPPCSRHKTAQDEEPLHGCHCVEFHGYQERHCDSCASVNEKASVQYANHLRTYLTQVIT